MYSPSPNAKAPSRTLLFNVGTKSTRAIKQVVHDERARNKQKDQGNSSRVEKIFKQLGIGRR